MFDIRHTTLNRGRRQVLVLLACAIVLFLGHAFYLRCVAEDAFISFRFAENLAGGHGLVWNIGESPVEGFTNFLWVVLCAGAIKAGLNVVLFAQVVGILAGMVVLACVYRFAVCILHVSRGGAMAACFFAACSGPLATWAASGMETVPFALFVLWGTYAWLRFMAGGAMRHGLAGGLAMVAAALLRPEGVLVCGLVCGLCFVLWRRNVKPSRWSVLWPAGLFGILFAAYFIWRYRYFGFLLPNTFYAKTGGGVAQYLRGCRYAMDFGLFYVLPLLPVAALAAWIGAGNAGRRTAPQPGTSGSLPEDTYSIRRTGVITCVTVPAVYGVYIVYVGGDYMAMYRFWVPMVPFVALLFGWIMDIILNASSGVVWRRCVAVVVVVLTCTLLLWPSTPVEALVLRKPRYHHGRFQGVYRERWHTARLAAIGNFFAHYREDASEMLATDAIGAIGYYSHMKVLGMHGLVDTHIAHLERGRATLGTGLPGHEKGDMAYIFSREPDYVMFSRNLTPTPHGWPSFGAKPDAQVRASYRLEAEWIKDVANGEEGYFTFLVRKASVRAQNSGAQ